jgi:hypothetical protein
VGLRAGQDVSEKRKTLATAGIQTPSRPVSSLVTTPTEPMSTSPTKKLTEIPFRNGPSRVTWKLGQTDTNWSVMPLFYIFIAAQK